MNEFWKQDRFDPTQALDAKFYFYLLDECNKREWINPFELQSRITEISLLITRKTIGEVRNRLKQRGLIDFVASNNKPTVYKLIGVEESPNNCLSNCFLQGTFKKHLEVQSGNIKGDNSETLIEDLRLKTKDKEILSKESTKKVKSPKEKFSQYRTNASDDNYKKFLVWLEENAPYVSTNIGPMTEVEFLKLKGTFGAKAIMEKILNLENRKDLRKRYVSLYRTILNWCKND